MLKSFTQSERSTIFFGIGASLAALTGLYIVNSRLKTSQVGPSIHPDGEPKSTKTKMLENGATILQSKNAIYGHNIYLVAFHPMADDPCHQMEAHHYCKQVNEDFAQCLLFDGNTSEANLTGLEYIISEKLFNQLPTEEKKFWHPHNFEIFSGMLVAPGLPSIVEKELLKTKLNSYGKTFHTWRAKCWEGDKPYLDTLPKGDAILAWSFNHNGEIKPNMVPTRDQNMRIDTLKKSEERQDLLDYAHPQEGVNKLLKHFPVEKIDNIPGVMDAEEEKRPK